MTAPAHTPLRGLRVLALSPVGSYGGFNTSVHRIKALESLGAEVLVVDTALRGANRVARLRRRVQNRMFLHGLRVPLPDLARDAVRLLAAARAGHWDILWLEKALTIGADTLRGMRDLCPPAKIIGFSPDDMQGRHNQSQQFLEALPLYDCFITTKSPNVRELRALGCPQVIQVGNGFDPTAFRPVAVSSEDERRLGGDVGFIGSYERDRAELMSYLARSGLSVRIWGGGWHKLRRSHPNLQIEGRHLYGEDFARACAAFKINLGFLRKLNRDTQTTRSVEIPACRGFMLAERTEEHLAMFEEGKEAEFFDSREELLEKCRRYLRDETSRVAIAARGHERCMTSGYSNAARLSGALRVIL
jgi:spore maturation protein CgeB